MRALFALIALLALTAARDPILVPEVSQHEVQLRQGFTGTELLLYGAILDPSGTRAGRDYDIVVVLKGPRQSIVVREKSKVAGIWINADSTEFRSAPLFYSVASSKPIERIVDDKTAAIYELGLPWLQLSPIGAIDPARQDRFSKGLVSLNVEDGLYREDGDTVRIKEQVLYQVRIALPSNVPAGDYTAETFAITRGRVVASAITPVVVRKIGFEGAAAEFAEEHALLYGLFAVALSVLMGWGAGRLFTIA